VCLIAEAEPVDLYRRHLVGAARKPHQCYECGRQIQVGEAYDSATYLWDGRWETNHTCQHCMAAQQWLREQCGGYLHGGLLEDLEEHRYVYPLKRPTTTLLRLIVGMRRHWASITDASVLMRPRLLA
jgi:hypothetical protein